VGGDDADQSDNQHDDRAGKSSEDLHHRVVKLIDPAIDAAESGLDTGEPFIHSLVRTGEPVFDSLVDTTESAVDTGEPGVHPLVDTAEASTRSLTRSNLPSITMTWSFGRRAGRRSRLMHASMHPG
jgi:hypothetical protein